MSYYKDSSLARTRHKRSHRIPARFDDFSEFPADARNVVSKKAAPFHPTSTSTSENFKKNAPQSSNVEDNNDNDNNETSENSTTKFTSTKLVIDTTPQSSPPVSSTDTSLTLSLTVSDMSPYSTPAITPEAKSSINKCKTAASNHSAKTSAEQAPATPTPRPIPATNKSNKNEKKRAILPSSEKDNNKAQSIPDKPTMVGLLKEKVIPALNPPTPIAQPLANNKSQEKSKNSTNISTKIQQNNFDDKDITKKFDAPIETLKSSSSGSAIKSPARKKSKGSSIMVKKQASSSLLQNSTNTTNSTNMGTNNRINNINICSSNNGVINNHRQIQPQQQPIARCLNNLAHSFTQYGTRYLYNEPVLLPRSVGNIAPITTTNQQIAEMAKKPPFISKKAEACLAYQEERKFDQITSNFIALVRITNYLEVRDLMNLRLVNKAWKSIIDSDAVWKRVVINDTSIKNWSNFRSFLTANRPTELVLNLSSLREKDQDEVYQMMRIPSIKKITITSKDRESNKQTLELLCLMNVGSNIRSGCLPNPIHIHWKVKVAVDDAGLVLVDIQSWSFKSPIGLKYCYDAYPEWLTKETCWKTNNSLQLDVEDSEKQITRWTELSELEDLFNGATKDLSDLDKTLKPIIEIEPI